MLEEHKHFWLLRYEDSQVEDEVFTDETIAKQRYDQAAMSWNVTLFSECRRATGRPAAEPGASPLRTMRAMIPCRTCNGKGDIERDCTLCGDSTYDHFCNDIMMRCPACHGRKQVEAEVYLFNVPSPGKPSLSIKPRAVDFVVTALLKELKRYESETRVSLPKDLSADALTSIENLCKIPGVWSEVDSLGCLTLRVEFGGEA